MAKKKKDDSSLESKPPDLFALLTPPGSEGKFDRELALETVTPQQMPVDSPAPLSPDSPDAGDCNTLRNPPESSDSWEKLRKDGLACKGCELYKTRMNFVLGEGPLNADLVFIGEAPGADEDATGRPFVGLAGRHLDKILSAAGFRREDVYICNILKDRPPNNRTPTTEEMNACSPLLERQLAMLHPKIIALLGNTSIKYAIGPDAPGITKIHGQWFTSIFGIPCMPLYHPSYLLRYQARTTGSPNWQMWQDIQTLKKRYDELCGA